MLNSGSAAFPNLTSLNFLMITNNGFAEFYEVINRNRGYTNPDGIEYCQGQNTSMASAPGKLTGIPEFYHMKKSGSNGPRTFLPRYCQGYSAEIVEGIPLTRITEFSPRQKSGTGLRMLSKGPLAFVFEENANAPDAP